MSEYDGLVKRLRQEAKEWCVNCCYRGGDCICTAPDDRKKDCDIYTKLQAADAIENIQGQLSVCREGTKVRFVKNDDGTTEVMFENQWIPVTERLPEKEGKFLVCGQWRGKPMQIWICERVKLGPVSGWVNRAGNPVISHWMPLPEPPEEET